MLNKDIGVIGVGGGGSWDVLLLARMGFKNITVYDHDRVEAHNIASQAYNAADIGRKKVLALKDRCSEVASIELKTCAAKWDGTRHDVMIVCVDDMDTRAAIWAAIKDNRSELYIEGRTAGEYGRIYTVTTDEQAAQYERTLYPQAEADSTPCGGQPIAYANAMFAAWDCMLLAHYLRGETIPFETIADLRVPIIQKM